jgi:hypothetical protein
MFSSKTDALVLLKELIEHLFHVKDTPRSSKMAQKVDMIFFMVEGSLLEVKMQYRNVQ